MVKRRGREAKKFTYTMEMAKLAGVVKPGSNWLTVPHRMLEARASSWASDVEFPDAAMGLPTIEEAEDFHRPGEMRGEVVPPTVPARDWKAEAEKLKAELLGAKDAEAAKLVRARCTAFYADAPAEAAKDLQTFYNELKAKAQGGKKAPADAPPAATAPPAASKPAEYLAPHLRGDSYDGPLEPPVPFGGP